MKCNIEVALCRPQGTNVRPQCTMSINVTKLLTVIKCFKLEMVLWRTYLPDDLVRKSFKKLLWRCFILKQKIVQDCNKVIRIATKCCG